VFHAECAEPLVAEHAMPALSAEGMPMHVASGGTATATCRCSHFVDLDALGLQADRVTVVRASCSPRFSKTFAAGLAGASLTNGLAWFLVSFAIFTMYMTFWSLHVNVAVFLVFMCWR